jgi:alpha-D-ribose 1-methylphosphonate 5-triphosphate diphosphatase PhnM
MKKLNLQLLIMIVLMNSPLVLQGMLISKRAEQERSSRIIMKKKAAAKAKQEKEAAEARIRIEERLQKLANYWNKYYRNPGLGLKAFFGLSPKANRYTITDRYNKYINKNNLEKLKLQESDKEISHQAYEEKLLKLKKLREAYEKYLSEHPLDPDAYELHKIADL